MEGYIIKSLPLLDTLLEQSIKGMRRFHTPGHKGKMPLLENMGSQSIADIDLTELPGLDNLHQPVGIIAEAQANCAQWLGVKHTFFLVNGASVGIQAAILGCTGPKDIVLIPRNAHKSVTAALILSGATPIYYLPEVHPEFGLPLGQACKPILDKLELHPEVKLLFGLYPTYYGTTWDLEIVRANWNGTMVVDEAHGAHLPFYEGFPKSATRLGADVVIQSSHKTLAAFTQAAMLHIGQACPVPSEYFLHALDILHTTSPSYLLMASLESAFWDGVEKGKNSHWSALVESCLQLKQQLLFNGIRVLNCRDIGNYGIAGVDPTKILIKTPSQGASEFVNRLVSRHGIQPELWDSENVLFLIGAGDTPETVKALEKALLVEFQSLHTFTLVHFPNPAVPKQALTPREAYLSQKELIPFRDSVGRICGETLSPYPPGIPAIVPGEIIDKDMIEYINWSKDYGIHWQGNADPNLERVLVIREN
jgi:arginine decarboxylase